MDGNMRPYWLVTVLPSAPEATFAHAARSLRVLRLEVP
jgi:hypothetical protein